MNMTFRLLLENSSLSGKKKGKALQVEEIIEDMEACYIKEIV